MFFSRLFLPSTITCYLAGIANDDDEDYEDDGELSETSGNSE